VRNMKIKASQLVIPLPRSGPARLSLSQALYPFARILLFPFPIGIVHEEQLGDRKLTVHKGGTRDDSDWLVNWANGTGEAKEGFILKRQHRQLRLLQWFARSNQVHGNGSSLSWFEHVLPENQLFFNVVKMEPLGRLIHGLLDCLIDCLREEVRQKCAESLFLFRRCIPAVHFHPNGPLLRLFLFLFFFGLGRLNSFVTVDVLFADGDLRRRGLHRSDLPGREGDRDFGFAVARFVRDPHGAVEEGTSAALLKCVLGRHRLAARLLAGELDLNDRVDIGRDA